MKRQYDLKPILEFKAWHDVQKMGSEQKMYKDWTDTFRNALNQARPEWGDKLEKIEQLAVVRRNEEALEEGIMKEMENAEFRKKFEN